MIELFIVYVMIAVIGIIIAVCTTLDAYGETDCWKWVGIAVIWPLALVMHLSKGIFRGIREIIKD